MRDPGRNGIRRLSIDFNRIKVDDGDVSYDLTRIIDSALNNVLSKDDVVRLERFIEKMTNKSIGEVFAEDTKKVIELLEMAFGISSHKIINDLIRELIHNIECDIDLRETDLKNVSEYEKLRMVIDSIMECLRGRSKEVRSILNNILEEVKKAMSNKR